MCSVGWGAAVCSSTRPQSVTVRPTHHSGVHVSPKRSLPRMAEEMKLEAVVVTEAEAEEEDSRRAFAKTVHITALHAHTKPMQPTWSSTGSCGMLCGVRPFTPTHHRPGKPCREGSQGQPDPDAPVLRGRNLLLCHGLLKDGDCLPDSFLHVASPSAWINGHFALARAASVST